MNKRQRKKHRLWPFTEYGFTIEGTFLPPLEDPLAEAKIDELIDLVIAQDLQLGGSADPNGFSFYISRYRGTATNTDRKLLVDLFVSVPEVSHVIAHELEDAWYPRKSST